MLKSRNVPILLLSALNTQVNESFDSLERFRSRKNLYFSLFCVFSFSLRFVSKFDESREKSFQLTFWARSAIHCDRGISWWITFWLSFYKKTSVFKMKIYSKTRILFEQKWCSAHTNSSWLLLCSNIKSTLNFNWKLADTKRQKIHRFVTRLVLLVHRKRI